MNPNVIAAVFKRNLGSYFSSLTGYVFILLFVFASGAAAFWPHEFFLANLANLDQLNYYFPFIMLVFVPTITMSIWSEERRLGTDELLLTIPATDLDVVLGKFLAALAIFTVSLLFSLTNVAILYALGSPDLGVLVSTYFGYWLVGLAMLSIGMVASFLTSNLTVAFILGVVFNAPLVFAARADMISGNEVALAINQWSVSSQFRGFGRGVISLSGIVFFVSITVAMLYLSIVLIGRRHWLGGRDGQAMIGHYIARAVCILLIVIGVNAVFADWDVRRDISQGGISTLSPITNDLIDQIEDGRTVHIDAYVSPTVPESYVQTRLNLLAMLDEFDSRGGDQISVRVHRTEPLSENADIAEQQYGIEPREVTYRERGGFSRERIFLAAAVNSGLEKKVVPFFDRGIPAEYELIRSIATVTSKKKRRVGVVSTDARVFEPTTDDRNEALIEELKKQYDVVRVDASSPIETDRYDCLLAIQPSSLPPEGVDNLVAAVKSGVPTAVFEDPVPFMDRSVPGTRFPRRTPGGPMAMFQGGQAPPKGDIGKLWDLLGIRFDQNNVVWQSYDPYPILTSMPQYSEEWVWADEAAGDHDAFAGDEDVSSGLHRMLFLFPGAIQKRPSSRLEFSRLVSTTRATSGETPVSAIMDENPFAQGGFKDDFDMHRIGPTEDRYHIAAHIHGELGDDQSMSDAGAEEAADDEAGEDGEGEEEKPKRKGINAIVVADIDCLYGVFFMLRASGEDPDAEVNIQTDNVTFALNVIDKLAGDERFIALRKRGPEYRTLVKFEEMIEDAKRRTEKRRQEYIEEFDTAIKAEQQKLDEAVEKLRNDPDMSEQQKQMEVRITQATHNRMLEVKREQLAKKRDRGIREIKRQLEEETREKQANFKLLAVTVPPLLPLLLGSIVYIRRRSRETEGVAQTRLR